TTKVNLVKIPSTASSPRDTALAAVICSALATVLLALLILCVIYCKRQFMEKKPSWSLRSQDIHYNGSELSCFDRPRLNEYDHRTRCQCQRSTSQTCGPVHLIPSLCCDETCSLEHSSHSCAFHSQTTLNERASDSVGEMIPTFLGSLSHSTCGDISDAWPLMQNSACCDSISFCESYSELAGGSAKSCSPETENAASVESDNNQDLSEVLISAKSLDGDIAKSFEISKHTTCIEVSSLQNSVAAETQPKSKRNGTANDSTD
ncbi:TNR19 factor, partial [Chroicocephalus maculipennis]|nr:TNR19 factor [Chroicocephalus maculipennis]